MRPSHLEYLRQSWALRETGHSSRTAEEKAGRAGESGVSESSSSPESRFGPAYRVSFSSFSNPVGYVAAEGSQRSPASPDIIRWSNLLQGWI